MTRAQSMKLYHYQSCSYEVTHQNWYCRMENVWKCPSAVNFCMDYKYHHFNIIEKSIFGQRVTAIVNYKIWCWCCCCTFNRTIYFSLDALTAEICSFDNMYPWAYERKREIVCLAITINKRFDRTRLSNTKTVESFYRKYFCCWCCFNGTQMLYQNVEV